MEEQGSLTADEYAVLKEANEKMKELTKKPTWMDINPNPTVAEIVGAWLIYHNYGGLYTYGCCCRVGDATLMRCDNNYLANPDRHCDRCRAGYSDTVVKQDGEKLWCVGPKKLKEGERR